MYHVYTPVKLSGCYGNFMNLRESGVRFSRHPTSLLGRGTGERGGGGV